MIPAVCNIAASDERNAFPWMVAASAAAAGAVTAATMQQRPCLPADSSSHKLSWAVLSLLCISSVAAQSGTVTGHHQLPAYAST